MNSFLFKLRFTTAVHFGPSDSALSIYSSNETFCADTLFSALCHTALSMWGETGIEKLCAWVKADALRLSDAMPRHGDTLYLPKPMAQSRSDAEIPPEERKAMKKMQWIPVDAFDRFACSLAGGEPFSPRQYDVRFGSSVESARARMVAQGNISPYVVGTFVFEQDCGLYVLVQCAEKQQAETLHTLLEALGASGIGGKVSSGYGRFVLDGQMDLTHPQDSQTEWFRSALQGEHPRYLLVTASLPRDEELDKALEDASFALIRRSGFVRSDTYAQTARKKHTQYFLASGSVVSHRFDGDLYQVGYGGTHPVYRYGRPVFLGVNL